MLLGVKQKFASFSCYNRNVLQVERYEWRLLFYIALISNAQFISCYVSSHSEYLGLFNLSISHKGGGAMNNENSNNVVVVDIKMPFMSMVVFMVKWAIASIPAIIILMVLVVIFGGIFRGFLLAMGNH